MMEGNEEVSESAHAKNESVERLMEQEKRTQAIIDEAHGQLEEILARAGTDADSIREKARQSAAKRREAMLEAAVEKAKKEKARIIDDAKKTAKKKAVGKSDIHKAASKVFLEAFKDVL